MLHTSLFQNLASEIVSLILVLVLLWDVYKKLRDGDAYLPTHTNI